MVEQLLCTTYFCKACKMCSVLTTEALLFRCLSLMNSSFLVRQHVHCLRYQLQKCFPFLFYGPDIAIAIYVNLFAASLRVIQENLFIAQLIKEKELTCVPNCQKSYLLYICFSTTQIITKSTRTITLELKRKEGFAAQTQPHHGKLIIHAEESLASKITTEIVFRCLSLESKDLFSKSVSLRIYSLYLFTKNIIKA